ncbi:MAG: hypothetical protein IIV96_02685, partial [Ruminococcus sp.]|nr:hypothetical protein [Ruminococcus sp.]
AKQAQMTLTDYLIECSRNTDITVTDLSEVLHNEYVNLPQRKDTKHEKQKSEHNQYTRVRSETEK